MKEQCNLCGNFVNGFTSVMNFTFSNQTTEKVSEAIRLSCECTMDFATFDIDFDEGLVKIVSELTDDVLITYYDIEVHNEEEV